MIIAVPADGATGKLEEAASSWRPAFAALYNTSGYRMKPEHLMAGVAGGVVATMILHPLDTLRTRLAGTAHQCDSTFLQHPIVFRGQV